MKEKIDVNKVYKDLQLSIKSRRKLVKEMRKDAEFAMGKQWSDDDKNTLEEAGVKALTINKIKPMIKLITGIERQGRTDFMAFPEGTEDELVSEVATRLLKNVSKVSRVQNKMSEMFKEGITVGQSFIEPHVDYTFDLINGDLKFRKINGSKVYPDPASEEYDLSDARFVIKVTRGLSKEDLFMIFPDEKEQKKIEEAGPARIDLENIINQEKLQKRDYESFFKESAQDTMETEEGNYDLVEYYYKKMIDVHYVATRTAGILAELPTKEQAEEFINQRGVDGALIISKSVPEIRLKQVVGKVEISDDRAWSYPRWRSYPVIPFIAEWWTLDIEDVDLMIQGIVRGLKDLQEEYNKRRTQELRHLNSSINSGNIIPKNALDRRNMNKMKRFGSSPGVTIEYDVEKAGGTTPASWRITPTPLSQGHAQLAAENAQDIKEASGVNPDLLANDSQSQSGRAILLKQRQGLVMIQEALDNYTHTKELIGRFILSQLGEVYTVETAIRVLGNDFIASNFKRPVFDEEGNPIIDENGNVKTETDQDEAGVIVNKILNDSALGKFDVSIGDGPFNETIKFMNFVTLMDMVEKGVPIPPDVIIEESSLSESQKMRIKESIDRAQAAQQQASAA